MKKALLFVCDYTDRGRDLLFLWSDGVVIEITAHQLVQEVGEIVCHDYWLIASNIFKKQKLCLRTLLILKNLRYQFLVEEKIERLGIE